MEMMEKMVFMGRLSIHYVNGSEIVGQKWMLMEDFKDKSEGSQTKRKEIKSMVMSDNGGLEQAQRLNRTE